MFNYKMFIYYKFGKILPLLSVVFIFLFNFNNISDLTSPMILFDEFGYWATGSVFSGENWSGVASEMCPYYSYGYGFILGIIKSFIEKPAHQYQVAILFNCLFICGSFLISRYVFIKLFDNRNLITILSFIICFYPSVIYHSQVAWSETLLLFVFWISILFLFNLLINPSIVRSILFGISVTYMYVIHQRSIGILILSLAIMCFLVWNKKINFRQFSAYITTLIILFFIHKFLKDFLYIALWNNQTLNLTQKGELSNLHAINDYAGQLKKLKFFFSAQGISFFLISLLGKLYYAGISSFFLIYFGLEYIFNRIFSRKSRIKNNDNKFFLKKILFVYFASAFFITLFISALFMINPGRIDSIIYGRYTDWLLGPLMMLGVINLYNKQIKIKLFITYILITIIYSIILYFFIIKYNLKSFFSSCSPFGQYFREIGNYKMEWTLFMSHTLIMVIILLIFIILKSKKNIYFSFLIMVFIWTRLTYYSINQTIDLSKIDELNVLISEIQEKNSLDVFYVSDTEDRKADTYMGSMQFLLKDISVKCVDQDRLREINEAYVLISSEYMEKNKIEFKNYKLVNRNSIFNLFYIKQN